MENSFKREPGNTFGIKDLTPKERKGFKFPVEKAEKKKGFWDYVGYNVIDKNVKGSLLPTTAYRSQTYVYGGHLRTDEKGMMIFDIRSKFSDRFDVWGDKKIRAFDDNVVRNPLKMLRRRPRELIRRLPFKAEAKRYRVQTPQDTYEVVKRLGLEEYYGPHPKGLVMKKPEILTDGTDLLDIFRQDLIKNEELNKVDRYEALKDTVLYVKNLHNQRRGGLGDLAIMDITFQKRENGRVSNPVVLIPNMEYNGKLNIPLREQKATDLIDLIFSAGTEEARRTQGDETSITRVIDTILNAYDEPDVIRFIKFYMKRGRLNMSGEGMSVERPRSSTADFLRPLFSVHVQGRMKGDAATDAGLRSLTINRCVEYEKAHASIPITTGKLQ